MDFLDPTVYENSDVSSEYAKIGGGPNSAQKQAQGNRVTKRVDGIFALELGLQAKICLIFSRRGVLPQKLQFLSQDRLIDGSDVYLPSTAVGFNSGAAGRFYAEFEATMGQLDSIVRELSKTVGIGGVQAF